MTTTTSPALPRLYFLLLGASGAWVPYLALHLQHRGLSAADIGRVMILMGLARVVAGPVWGLFADALRRDRALLALGTGFTAMIGVAVLVAPLWAVLPILAAHALFRAPLGALLDAAAIRALAADGRADAYGRLRLWGSIGYLVLSGVGGLLAGLGPALALWLAVATWALTAAVAHGADIGQPAPPANPLPALVAVLRAPRLGALLLGAVLHGTALGAYDTLYGSHLAARGHGPAWTGAAIGAGVITEVAVLWQGPRLIQSVGPWTLIAVAMALGALRWSGTHQLDDALALTLLQSSHGIVFGAFWIGLVEAARRLTPDMLRASVQALLVAAAYGIGPALCGWIATNVGSGGTDRVFEISAMCSAAGAALVWLARPRSY